MSRKELPSSHSTTPETVLRQNTASPFIWFTIAGSDLQSVSVKAKIKGNTVRVTNDKVKEPVAVRYAWQGLSDLNLSTRKDYPRYPFIRTNKAGFLRLYKTQFLLIDSHTVR
jgi:hypothetical protein